MARWNCRCRPKAQPAPSARPGRWALGIAAAPKNRGCGRRAPRKARLPPLARARERIGRRSRASRQVMITRKARFFALHHGRAASVWCNNSVGRLFDGSTAVRGATLCGVRSIGRRNDNTRLIGLGVDSVLRRERCRHDLYRNGLAQFGFGLGRSEPWRRSSPRLDRLHGRRVKTVQKLKHCAHETTLGPAALRAHRIRGGQSEAS